MLRLFLDVSDLRKLFQSTTTPDTAQSNFLTKADFKAWLIEATNWVGVCPVDFSLTDVSNTHSISESILRFKGIEELYQMLKDALDVEELTNKTIYSCFGFIDGDVLYLMMEVDSNE